MKVLHIDEQTGWRGGEQQASWLMQGLVARGVETHLAARPGSRFLNDTHGAADAALRRWAVPLRGEWDVFSANTLARIVRDAEIDILHAHTSHAHTLACLARRKAGRGRVVVSRRVSFPPRPGVFNRWKYAQPDMFLSVSGRVDETLAEYGIPASRRRIVHSAVDPARLDALPLSRAELDVPENAPLVVSAGALVAHKDIENLVEAAAIARGAFPDLRVVVAGEGDRRAAIEARVAALGLDGCVTLLGHRNDAPRLIRAGDCYVSSSWSEGLGTSILEALACGTPVVACEAGGAGEMVIPGETGRLVPVRNAGALADAIIATLDDPGGARAMADRGRAHVEAHFLVDRMVEGTLAAYGALHG